MITTRDLADFACCNGGLGLDLNDPLDITLKAIYAPDLTPVAYGEGGFRQGVSPDLTPVVYGGGGFGSPAAPATSGGASWGYDAGTGQYYSRSGSMSAYLPKGATPPAGAEVTERKTSDISGASDSSIFEDIAGGVASFAGGVAGGVTSFAKSFASSPETQAAARQAVASALGKQVQVAPPPAPAKSSATSWLVPLAVGGVVLGGITYFLFREPPRRRNPRGRRRSS